MRSKPTPFASIDDIKRANADLGHHYFEPAAMRFFGSRIGRTLYAGRFFVTSEQSDEASPRLYSIRMARDDGSIESVGEFQAYESAAAAKRALRIALAGPSFLATRDDRRVAGYRVWRAMLGELPIGYWTTREEASAILAEIAAR